HCSPFACPVKAYKLASLFMKGRWSWPSLPESVERDVHHVRRSPTPIDSRPSWDRFRCSLHATELTPGRVRAGQVSTPEMRSGLHIRGRFAQSNRTAKPCLWEPETPVP